MSGAKNISISLPEKAWDKVLAVLGEVPAKDLTNAQIMLEIQRQGAAAINKEREEELRARFFPQPDSAEVDITDVSKGTDDLTE